MIFRFFSRRSRDRATIEGLYGAIVAQARDPAFYADYGAPDTVEGRFDLIVLHLVLVIRRMRAGGQDAQDFAQGVFDCFCRDMEHNLREMGVSDLGVPKRMRAIGESFYGRAASYEAALAQEASSPLEEAVARNIFGVAAAPGAARMADYARRADSMLASQPLAEIIAGKLAFPALR